MNELSSIEAERFANASRIHERVSAGNPTVQDADDRFFSKAEPVRPGIMLLALGLPIPTVGLFALFRAYLE